MLVFEPFFLKWYPVGPYACLYILNKVISLEKYLSYDLCKGPLLPSNPPRGVLPTHLSGRLLMLFTERMTLPSRMSLRYQQLTVR